MPFAAMSQLDEEKLKTQGDPVNISGQSAGFSTNVPGQETAAPGEKPKASSGGKFTNIQSYLDNNKQQGEEMSGKLASNVSSSADDAISKVGSFQSSAPKFEAYDPSEIYANVTNLKDDQVAKYNEVKSGYKGPQQLEQVAGYKDAFDANSKAVTNVANAGSSSGQRQLFKDTYGRGNYSAGENSLDQAIIGGNPNASKNLNDLSTKYSGINSLFSNAQTDVGNKVNQAKTGGLANQQAIATGETNALSGLVDPIQARVGQVNDANRINADATLADLSDENLSFKHAKDLGLDYGTNIYDMNLQSYYTPNYTQSNINNVANADERARYLALTKLISGQSGDLLTSDGKPINPNGFNRAQFDTDLAAKKAEYLANAGKQTFSGASTYASPYGIMEDSAGELIADMTAGDYLAGKRDPTFRQGRIGFEGEGLDPKYAEVAKEPAKQALFKQIEDWLAANKYNRTIQQEKRDIGRGK